MAVTKVYGLRPTVTVSPATAGPPTDTKAGASREVRGGEVANAAADGRGDAVAAGARAFAVNVAVVPVVPVTEAEVLVAVPVL